MVLVANPLYDVVFKYLLEEKDQLVALQGRALEEKEHALKERDQRLDDLARALSEQARMIEQLRQACSSRHPPEPTR